MTDSLDTAMRRAVEALKDWPERTVRLFHHNDADGLSAGAIAETFGYHQLSHWLGLAGLIPTAAAGWAMAGDAGVRRWRRASARR